MSSLPDLNACLPDTKTTLRQALCAFFHLLRLAAAALSAEAVRPIGPLFPLLYSHAPRLAASDPVRAEIGDSPGTLAE